MTQNLEPLTKEELIRAYIKNEIEDIAEGATLYYTEDAEDEEELYESINASVERIMNKLKKEGVLS